MTGARSFSHKAARPSPAKRKVKISGDQGDFLQQLEGAPAIGGDLDIHFELLGAITACLREARGRGLSREQVIFRMNELLPEAERPLTRRQLDSWTAHSKEYSEFPARYLPAFCAAVDSPLPLLVLARAIGRELVDAREARAKRLGEAQIEAARIRREAQQILKELGE